MLPQLQFAFTLTRHRGSPFAPSTWWRSPAARATCSELALNQWSTRCVRLANRKQHIDILSARFVLQPQRFDVVAATNLFGDILSDLGPATTGTIGLAPSANLNPERKFPSLFEPVHGSAPDTYVRISSLLCTRSGYLSEVFGEPTQSDR